MAREYDVVVLGGGTGGYVAAIRASQLGYNVAIVEKEHLGGTCLHKGCIPSKTFLRSAEIYSLFKKSADFGIITNEIQFNFSKIQERKDRIIKQLYQGVQSLVKKNKIDVYKGIGRILGPSIFSPLPGTISVEMESENEMLVSKNVVIATGSKPKTIPNIEVDGKRVLTSDEALEMDELPKSIIIVGGGVIGIEWASMLADFDVQVTVIESNNQLLMGEDRTIVNALKKSLELKGIQFILNAELLPDTLETIPHGIKISVKVEDEERELFAEKMLISIGRKGNVEDIGLSNTDIEVENDFIQVNAHYQTKNSHIYAIGDVIGGYQLAHVAMQEGIYVAEHMAGLNPLPIEKRNIPKCIYSNPEMATIGYTEEEAKEMGIEVKIGKFPFQANGKALIVGNYDGFVKVVADKKTNDILGIHMIGPNVTDLISEASLAKILDATPWEIGNTIHPHPSLTETLREAALAVDDIAIHI